MEQLKLFCPWSQNKSPASVTVRRGQRVEISSMGLKPILTLFIKVNVFTVDSVILLLKLYYDTEKLTL